MFYDFDAEEVSPGHNYITLQPFIGMLLRKIIITAIFFDLKSKS